MCVCDHHDCRSETLETLMGCDSFHPYTSNPMLYKACNGPVFEHESYMKRWKQKQEARMALSRDEYEKKRAEIIEACATEIDPEEEIDLGGGIKVTKSVFEKLRQVALQMATTSGLQYPPFGATSYTTASTLYPVFPKLI